MRSPANTRWPTETVSGVPAPLVTVTAPDADFTVPAVSAHEAHDVQAMNSKKPVPSAFNAFNAFVVTLWRAMLLDYPQMLTCEDLRLRCITGRRRSVLLSP